MSALEYLLTFLHLRLETTENLCSSLRPLIRAQQERLSDLEGMASCGAGLSLQSYAWNDPKHCHVCHPCPLALSLCVYVTDINSMKQTSH